MENLKMQDYNAEPHTNKKRINPYIILAAVLIIIMLFFSTSIIRRFYEHKNTVIKNNLTGLNSDINYIKELNNKKEMYNQKIKLLDAIPREKYEMHDLMEKIVGLIPEGMILHGIEGGSGQMKIQCISKDTESIAQFAGKLEGYDGLSDVRLLDVDTGGRDLGIKFSVHFKY